MNRNSHRESWDGSEAPYFVILTLRREDRSLVERRVVANPHRSLERGKRIRVAEWLVGQKADVVLSRERLHGRGPAYVFRDAGIELRMIEAESIEAAIDVPPGDPTAG